MEGYHDLQAGNGTGSDGCLLVVERVKMQRGSSACLALYLDVGAPATYYALLLLVVDPNTAESQRAD